MSTDALVFDPASPTYLADPYPTFRRLRHEAPVYWWDRGHMWLLSRYPDVEAALKDPRFSVDVRQWRFYREDEGFPSIVREVAENGLFQVGKTDHTRIRKLVAPSFTPRAIEKREALVQEVLDDLFADIGEADEIDVVSQLAEPLPIRVISRMLGIPPEHDHTFREWGHKLIQITFPVLPPEERLAVAKQVPAGFDLLTQIIEERRRNPSDDMLSGLIHAQEQGDKLTSLELLSLVGGLVTAGSETTVHLVAFAVLELLRHPEVLARVRADADLLPGVMEEVLRHDNFGALGTTRYALEDVEIRGQAIPKGDMIMLLLGSAMHDEEVWPDAESFDIDREATPNVSFGRGAHFCLGAHLARAEGRMAVRSLLTRYPDLALAGEPTFRPHPLLRHMTTLPVRVRARTKA